jgi:hypothetical protein
MQSESDLDFMPRALDTIIRGRAVLKWSYIHGFWMKAEDEQRLFQHLQGVLEGNLEMLHNSLEPQEVSKILYSERDFGWPGSSGPLRPLTSSWAPGGGGGGSTGAAASSSGAAAGAAAGVGARRSSGSASTAVGERLITYRQKVIDMAATTSSFITKLIEGVENGLMYQPETDYTPAGAPTGGAPSQPIAASSTTTTTTSSSSAAGAAAGFAARAAASAGAAQRGRTASDAIDVEP